MDWTLTELSQVTGVKFETLRDWRKEGLLPPRSGTRQTGKQGREALAYNETGLRAVEALGRWRERVGGVGDARLFLWLEGFDYAKPADLYRVHQEVIAAIFDWFGERFPIPDFLSGRRRPTSPVVRTPEGDIPLGPATVIERALSEEDVNRLIAHVAEMVDAEHRQPKGAPREGEANVGKTEYERVLRLRLSLLGLTSAPDSAIRPVGTDAPELDDEIRTFLGWPKVEVPDEHLLSVIETSGASISDAIEIFSPPILPVYLPDAADGYFDAAEIRDVPVSARPLSWEELRRLWQRVCTATDSSIKAKSPDFLSRLRLKAYRAGPALTIAALAVVAANAELKRELDVLMEATPATA